MTQRAAAIILASFVALPACLPDETRTPPGALVLEMVGRQVIHATVESDDGWEVKLSGVYVSVLLSSEFS